MNIRYPIYEGVYRILTVDLGVDIIATDHPEKFIMKYGKPSI